jgi:hypothetical protein
MMFEGVHSDSPRPYGCGREVSVRGQRLKKAVCLPFILIAEVQSNVTDNDSAKMTTSHGVIQGYNAQALVDGQEQIILHGRASGVGQDHAQIGPVLAGASEVLELAGLKDEVLVPGETQLSADCNDHSEGNLQACAAHQVDAYIPDNHFRQRDARFATQERPQTRVKEERFTLEDFQYDEKKDCLRCPQGKV